MTIEAARAAAAAAYPEFLVDNPRPISREDEFNKMVRDFKRLLLWHASRRLAAMAYSEVTAEDLVQETFMRAYQSWDQIRGKDATYYGGILLFILKQRISHHRTRRWTSKRSGQIVPLEDWSGGQQPPDQHTRLELAEAVAAVQRLKPQLRAVLSEVALGEPMFEIAAREGVSRQAIHAKVNRARLALMRELAAEVKKEGRE